MPIELMNQKLFQSLERLSKNNVSPVFSVNREGLILHANSACAKELEGWELGKGEPAPENLKALIESAFESTHPQQQSLSWATESYDFEVIPFEDMDFSFAVVHVHSLKSALEKRLKSIERFDSFLLSEKKNLLLVQNALDGIITIDSKGVVQSFNPAAEKIFGYSEREMMGKNIKQLMPEPDHSLHDGYLEKYLRTGIVNILGFSREVLGLRKDGASFPLEINISEMVWNEGREFVGIVRDITERRKMEDKLQKLSIMDGLTEIGNRRFFDDTLAKEWKRAMRDQFPVSIVLLDIDFFKLYNDAYGHLEGDTCLKRVAAALKNCIQRPADLVARYGGEEFVMILPETTSEGASSMAEAVRSSIENLKIEHTQNKVSSYVTVSAGVSTLIPQRGTFSEQLIAYADKALYRAKENGRNQVNVETP